MADQVQVDAMASGYVYLKNISGTVIKPITDLSGINMTTTNGIAVEQVNGGTIGIRDGYIESCYYNEMVDPGVGPANVDSSYIEGGTMFQLIGGYTVTDEIPPITGASHEKIPSEYSVRSAIDALATLGPSVVPGAGIVIETVSGQTGGTIAVAPGNGINVATAQQGGVSVVPGPGIAVDSSGVSFNNATVDAATPAEITGGTANKVIQADDLEVAIRMSERLLDLSAAYKIYWKGNIATADGVTTCTGVNTYGYATNNELRWSGDALNVLELGHSYIMVADIKRNGGTNTFLYAGNAAASNGNNVLTQNVWSTVYRTVTVKEDANLSYLCIAWRTLAANEQFTVEIKNLRLIDVTDIPVAIWTTIINNNGYLYEGGDGIVVNGKHIEVDEATPKAMMSAASDKTVTPNSLKSTLSVGQSVDCTSEPTTNLNNVLDSNGQVPVVPGVETPTVKQKLAVVYRDTFTLTNNAASGSSFMLGFTDGTYYPKAAATDDGTPLQYLFICDVKNNDSTYPLYLRGVISRNATSGDNYQNVDSILGNDRVDPGQTVRFAMKFPAHVVNNTATDTLAYIVFSGNSTTAYNITISHLRQFEVMALTDDAVKYLAGVPDPDAFDGLYLVKTDMVDPWVPYINMKSSPYTTIASGLNYKLLANDNSVHTLSTDTCPAGYYGRDAHLELFVGATGKVQVRSPLVLMQPLTPNSVNNCTIKFRDGQARLYVDDTAYGYTVTITGDTTTDGTLYYGISSSTSEYITFATTTDGQVSTFTDSAIVNTSNKYIIGNGADNTIIKGRIQIIKAPGKLTLTNCSYEGLSVSFSTLEVTNCKVVGCTANERMMYSGVNNSIISNTLFDSNSSGDYTYGYGGLFTFINASAGGRTVLVDGCTFTNNYAKNGNILSFSQMGSNSTCEFKNSVLGAGQRLAVDGTTTYSTYVTLTDNIIDGDVSTYATPTSAPTMSYVSFAGTNVLNGTVLIGNGAMNIAANAQLISPDKTGTIDWQGKTLAVDISNRGNLVFDGITFKRSYKSGGEGSQLVGHMVNPVFRNCVITGNTVTHGPNFCILAWGCHGRFENCTFTGNLGNYYGMVCAQWGASSGVTLDFDNCLVTGNTCQSQLLVTLHENWVLNVTGCTIADNTYNNAYRRAIDTGDNRRNVTINIENSVISDGKVGCNSNDFNVTLKNNELWWVDLTQYGTARRGYVYLGTNTILRKFEAGGAYVRAIAGSTVTFTTTYEIGNTSIFGTKSTAVCTVDTTGDTDVYTVGGSVTVVYPGGSTVLSGIGTYINANGSNDFQAPYVVTISGATDAAGGLLAGLLDTTKKYIVLGTADGTAVSEAYGSNINGRVCDFRTSDGDVIVGGTFGIAAGATVGMYEKHNTDGTVDIKGSTMTLSTATGTRNLLVNLFVNGMLVSTAAEASVTIKGTCEGTPNSMVRPLTGKYGFDIQRGTTIKNLITDAVQFYPQSSTGANILVDSCTISGSTGSWYGIVVSGQAGFSNKSTFNKCAISNNSGSCTLSTGFAIIELTGCTIKPPTGNGQVMHQYAGGITVFKNCVFESSGDETRSRLYLYNNETNPARPNYDKDAIIFDGTISGPFTVLNNSNYPNTAEITYIIAGSTINLSHTYTGATPIVGYKTGEPNVKVGTFSDTAYYDKSTWTTGGTATIITSGGTYTVSGEGTFIKKTLNPAGATAAERGTDLTVAVAT